MSNETGGCNECGDANPAPAARLGNSRAVDSLADVVIAPYGQEPANIPVSFRSEHIVRNMAAPSPATHLADDMLRNDEMNLPLNAYYGAQLRGESDSDYPRVDVRSVLKPVKPSVVPRALSGLILPRTANLWRIAVNPSSGLHPVAVEIPFPPRLIFGEQGPSVTPLAELLKEGRSLELNCGGSHIDFFARTSLVLVASKIVREQIRRESIRKLPKEEVPSFKSDIASKVKGVEDTSGTSSHIDGYNAKAQAEAWDDALNEGALPRSLAESILGKLRESYSDGQPPPGPSSVLPDALTTSLSYVLSLVAPKVIARLRCLGDCGPHTEIPCEKAIAPIDFRVSGVERRAAVEIVSEGVRLGGGGDKPHSIVTVEYQMQTFVYFDLHARVSCDCPVVGEA